MRTSDTSPLEALSPLAYLAERMAGRRAVQDGERPQDPLHAALDRGDHRAALRALMAEHGAAVYGYCTRVLGDATLGADVHQQVFEEAYRDLGKLLRPEHARSWLFGIANHRCLDAIKARRRREKRFVGDDDEALADVADEPRDLTERVDAPTVATALSACLRELSAESRMAVLLRFQEGMTYEDMGRMCREKSTTLQARVTRALPLLRRCLEGKGIEP
ncbi:RNA polymerase sigma factor [Sorangium sp. So ce1153]|uniref:RNA polymerase sigma factor n=1 Tax=Sorangium sp. So ce1153 TaxID=3133333 RepID=UPI003F63D0DB